uniref:Uncharacterized protein n=1 Tax=Anguilla anguilla TaxID=7936 RepID=A0A0E9XVI1_ANGAN
MNSALWTLNRDVTNYVIFGPIAEKGGSESKKELFKKFSLEAVAHCTVRTHNTASFCSPVVLIASFCLKRSTSYEVYCLLMCPYHKSQMNGHA